jgi:hypothetical protein
MKKSIGKPCEGKLHARFDEGGADCFIIFVMNNSKAIRLYSTGKSRTNVIPDEHPTTSRHSWRNLPTPRHS